MDQTLILLNTFQLLGVVFIPFTTSLYGSFSDLLLGSILLPINSLFIILTSTIAWFYATNPRRGFIADTSPSAVKEARVGSVLAVAVSALVVILSPFIGAWAFAAYALNAVLEPMMLRHKTEPVNQDELV